MCFICVQQRLQSGQSSDHIGSVTSAAADSVSRSFAGGSYYINSLLEGFSWTGGTGSATSIGYSFNVSRLGGSLFSTAERNAALDAMQRWQNVANVTFVSTSTGAASLTFSKDDLGSGIAGLATTSFTGTRILSSEVQIDTSVTSFTAGTFGLLTLLHEVGHALGLKHSGNYGAGDTGPFLPTAEDTNDATVMSYFDGTYTGPGNYPSTPMIYDIAAIQYLYGANTSFNAGDTVYSLIGDRQLATLWDGSGNDTLDAQSYAGGATLDLREGLAFVTRVGLTTFWNAFGANIENANGGNGSDTIYGNDLANVLRGLGASDLIQGGSGDDVIFGGAQVVDPNDGNDTISGGGGSDIIYANGGDDVVYGGLQVVDPGDAADLIFGGGGSDLIYANGGNDSVYGGGSGVDPNDRADTIFGGGGADVVYGNGGNDVLYGGGSNVDPNDAADTIFAGAGDDVIYGNGGNDLIYGNDGNDTFFGGAGDDIYSFGSFNGADVVAQFDGAGAAGGDIIRVISNANGNGIVSVQGLLAAITYTGSTTALLNLGSSQTITIQNITAGSLTASDFEVV